MKILKIIICALDGLFALLFLWLDIEIALKYFNEMPVVNESQLYLLAFSACLLSGIFFLALFVAGIKLAISDKRMRTLTVIMPSVLAVFWFSPFAAVPIAGSICNNSGYERLNYDELESQRELYSQKIYAIAENNGDTYTRGNITTVDKTERSAAKVSGDDGLTVKIELIYHKNYERLNLYAEVTISTGRDEEYDFSKPDRALEYVNALSGFELSSDICLETAFEEEYAQEEWYGYTGQFRALDKFSYINANQFNYSNDYGSFRQLVFRINSLCK